MNGIEKSIYVLFSKLMWNQKHIFHHHNILQDHPFALQWFERQKLRDIKKGIKGIAA